MARKSIDVKISKDNCPRAERDWGKAFRLTEMSAFQAEEWANRATLALVPRLSQNVSPDIAEELKENGGGMSTLAQAGLLLGNIQFPEMKELMRDLWDSCVQVIPEGGQPRPIAGGSDFGAEVIEEVQTIQFLRSEALKLHTGFILAGALFNLVADVALASPSLNASISQKP